MMNEQGSSISCLVKKIFANEFVMSSPIFYIPNIMSYLRFISLMIVLCIFETHTVAASVLYLYSQGADALDGPIARKLKQESHLGRILDFTIDRICTATLLCILAHLFPKYLILATLLLLLEITSHFFILYASNIANNTTHQEGARNTSGLLSRYYDKNNRLFMTFLCHSQEVFLGFIFLSYFYAYTWIQVGILISLPGFLLKNWLNILQIIHASKIALNHQKNIVKGP